MKRKIFAVLAIGTIAIASCKKDEPATPADPGTASVSGTLWANKNLDNDTDAFGFPSAPVYDATEVAKTGTIVTASIDSKDLDQSPDPAFTYQILNYTTAITAGGVYSFTSLPCYNWPIDVELRFNDFSDSQLAGGTVDNTVTYSTMGTVWTISIYAGAVVINPDYAYSYY